MNLTLEKIQQRLMSSDDLKTPLYIADKNDFKRNITDFVAAFRKYYPNYNIGYSFKTNYCKEFINVVKELVDMQKLFLPKSISLHGTMDLMTAGLYTMELSLIWAIRYDVLIMVE